MAESDSRSVPEETLKPFYQRASEAEDRLSRLEAALTSKKDSATDGSSKVINELQSQIKDACEKMSLEEEKNKKLAAENAKLQYRIQHLVQAVRDGDDKLEKMKVTMHEELETWKSDAYDREPM